MAVGAEDGEGAGADEGGAAGKTAAGGDGAVDEDVHATGGEGGGLSAEDREGAVEAGFEVVGPFVLGGVDGS